MTLTLTHLGVGMFVSMAGCVSLLWVTWIRPAHQKEVKLQVRLAQIEGRLENGRKEMDRLKDEDSETLALLRSIDERLRRLENQFSAVAPALAREA